MWSSVQNSYVSYLPVPQENVFAMQAMRYPSMYDMSREYFALSTASPTAKNCVVYLLRWDEIRYCRFCETCFVAKKLLMRQTSCIYVLGNFIAVVHIRDPNSTETTRWYSPAKRGPLSKRIWSRRGKKKANGRILYHSFEWYDLFLRRILVRTSFLKKSPYFLHMSTVPIAVGCRKKSFSLRAISGINNLWGQSGRRCNDFDVN